MVRIALVPAHFGANLHGPAKELDVDATQQWIDTGVDLRAGDSLQFTSTGTLTIANNKNNKTTGPDGAPRGFRDLLKSYPVNEAGQGALITGNNEVGTIGVSGPQNRSGS